MADDQALSSLYVMLGLDTVSFEAGADKASKIADRTAGDIDKSFGSIAEGRGGLMLTEEAIGIRLPRHLNTLIAKIPGVAAAFSAMLPIAGVIVAIEIISKLIEKHDALAAAQVKAATESTDLAIKLDDSSKSMELSNLKLRDQIANLEGGPKANRLKEALLESSIAADKLAASFATDFDKINAELTTSTGSIETMKTELGLIADHPLSLFSGESPKAKVDEINASIKLLTSQMLNVQSAQREMTKASSLDEQIKGLKQEQFEYQTVAKYAEAALAVVKKDAPDNIQLIQQLSQEWTTAETAVKNLGLQVTNSQLKTRVATDENKADANALAAAEWAGLERYTHIHEEYIKARKAQAEKNEKAAAEEAHAEEEANNAFHNIMAKNFEDGIKRSEELRESYAKLAEEQTKLGAKTKESSVSNQASLGVISAREEQQELKAIYQTESDDLKAHYATDKAALQAYINQQNAAAAAAAPLSEERIKALDNATKGQLKLNEATKAYDGQLAQLNGEILKLDTAITKDQASFTTFFTTMNTSLTTVGASIRTNLQQNMDRAFTDIGNGFGKMIVQGKNFGSAMKAVGQQIAESFISMMVGIALKWVTTHLLMEAIDKIFHTHLVAHAAAAAGAGGTASMAAAPFPANLTAPAFGLAMAADSLGYMGGASAEQGALIHAPSGGGVQINAHGEELILPAHISKGLQGMIAKNGGGHTYNIDARGADAGVEARIHRALEAHAKTTVARSIAAVNDRAARRA
jgi:hypothetical protein